MKASLHIITALCFISTGVAVAHTAASGIVKERMDAMEIMDNKAKIVKEMFQGKRDYQPSAVSDAAAAFVLHGKEMLALFPDTEASRHGHQTRALPDIWNEWQQFSSLVDNFITESQALQQTIAATEDKNKIEKAYSNAAEQCLTCHKRYRQRKNK